MSTTASTNRVAGIRSTSAVAYQANETAERIAIDRAGRPQLKRDPLGRRHTGTPMRSSLPYVALVAVVPAVCGGLSSQTAPVGPCAIPGVGTPDSLWRQVRASGFTFCVPGDWRPSGRARDSLDAQRWNGKIGRASCRERV